MNSVPNTVSVWKKVLQANAERWKTDKPGPGRRIADAPEIELDHVVEYWDRIGFVREQILSARCRM